MLKFYIPDRNYNRSSARLRGKIPSDNSGGKVASSLHELTDKDVVVFSKVSSVEDIHYALNNNIKFIFDICDDKFDPVKFKKFSELFKLAPYKCNLITVPSERMKEVVIQKSKTDKEVFVITDPYERPTKKPTVNIDGKIKLGFFGQNANFIFTPWEKIISKLEEKCIDFEIHAVTNTMKKSFEQFKFRHPKLKIHTWSFDIQTKVLDSCDMILSPVYNNSESSVTASDISYKSENRVVEAINAGKFVVTNYGIDSYMNLKEFIHIDHPNKLIDGVIWAIENPKERLQKVTAGQEYVKNNFSPECIGKTWLNACDYVRMN